MSRPARVPLAYSYLRFSSPEQAKGDSLRRQIELRDAWLARNDVRLDESVVLRDEGKSAFRGAHRENPDRHALAAFLKLVETGKVPRRSYLIVESLDRLSREFIVPAISLLLKLIDADIRVVQLLPVETVYDKDSADPMKLMMAIMELSRGHSESAVKSERVGRAWQAMRKRAAVDKTPMTSIVRGWLQMEDGVIVPVRDRVAIVKRIFKMVIAGRGMHAIATTLTSEGVPTFGKSRAWTPSILHKIVSTRAVLGEYQPRTGKGANKKDEGDPIPGYYPTVISEAEWVRAQASLASRHNAGRKPTRGAFNPFSGMLVDARDGAKIYLAHSGNPRSNYILVNYGAMYGKPGAVRVSFPFRAFIECVLATLKEVRAADILDEKSEDGDRIYELEDRRFALDEQIVKVETALAEVGDVAPVARALKRLEAQREEVNQLLVVERQRVATPPAAALADCHSLIEVFRKNDNPETRARLKVVLRRLVSRVACLFVARGRSRLAAVQIHFAGTERHRDLLISYTQGSGNTRVKAPASWFVVSDAWDDAIGAVDLSDKQHVHELEAHLMNVDLESLQQSG